MKTLTPGNKKVIFVTFLLPWPCVHVWHKNKSLIRELIFWVFVTCIQSLHSDSLENAHAWAVVLCSVLRAVTPGVSAQGERPAEADWDAADPGEGVYPHPAARTEPAAHQPAGHPGTLAPHHSDHAKLTDESWYLFRATLNTSGVHELHYYRLSRKCMLTQRVCILTRTRVGWFA